MSYARARLVLLAFVAIGAWGILAPTQASAFVGYYSCYDKPPYQWCDGHANGTYDGLHSWDYNQGWSNGYRVCQGVYKPSSGNYLYGNSCADNVVNNYYGDVTCVCYEAQIAQVGSIPVTINGFADADY